VRRAVKKKILIIEDNKDSLYLMKYFLEKKGFTVCEARTGAEGIALAAKRDVGLVLMDIQLPDMSGEEATKRIRESQNKRDLPIIAITAFAMLGDRERILGSGHNGYLSKPINPQTLLKEVEKHL
jgi:two-component system, cell cycle response regulator DivK